MPASYGSVKWIILTMTRDGLISEIARTTEKSTGYSSGELIGMPVTRILADASVFELEGMLKAVEKDGYWSGKLFHMDSGGRVLEAEGMLYRHEQEGSAAYSLASVSGLPPASTVRPDESLQQVSARLRGLAHEMNNPLAIIMGFAQLVMLDPRCEGSLRVNLDKMYSEIQRITDVLEKLQVYARGLQEKPTKKLDKTTSRGSK